MLKDGMNGKALFNGNVKICDGYKSNWFERLQTAFIQKDRDLVIVTYSLPTIDKYVVQEFLTNRKGKTILVYNSKFNDDTHLKYLQDFGVQLIPKEDCHAKIALISPDTVCIGSENFAFSNWFECNVIIKNRTAYDYQLKCLSEYLGFNPLNGEQSIHGCYSCKYFSKEYNVKTNEQEYKCNSPFDQDKKENLEKGCCENYSMKPRKEYVRYQHAINSPWHLICKDCVHSEQVFAGPERNYQCGWLCTLFGRFTALRDAGTPVDCGLWSKRQ